MHACFQIPRPVSGKGICNMLPTPENIATASPTRFRKPSTLVWKEADIGQTSKTTGDGRSRLLPNISDPCLEKGGSGAQTPRLAAIWRPVTLVQKGIDCLDPETNGDDRATCFQRGE